MKYVVILIFVCWAFVGMAQNSQYYRDYEELTDTKPINENAWKNCKRAVNTSWGSVDVRYSKTNVPDLVKPVRTLRLKGWRGERVHAQALLWVKRDCGDVCTEVTPLKSGKYRIPDSLAKTRWVRYVMTDELNKDGKGACGYRPDKSLFDSTLVADMLEVKKVLDVKAYTTRPVWVTIQIPQQARPGIYRGKVIFKSPLAKLSPLDLEIEVIDRELPAPEQWAFHLDLWQHPFAIARYYQVPLWSKEHFELMRPLMKILADAGQKAITTTLMYAPWGGQTYDKFGSMVMRIKRLDGSWAFDYAVFDKWVEFMMSIGIKEQINCYSMIPWKLSFQYFDQASNSLKYLDTQVGTPEFRDYWAGFLKDFAAHLKEKGWFGITTIAMDERPEKTMRIVRDMIKEADPGYKIALAGTYHESLQADLYDYSLASALLFPEKVLKERKAKGLKSTLYTCCAEPYPNTFTFSPTAEAAYLPLYAAAKGFDGYLRWAYNSWTENPLPDTRFHTWAAGDCYLVYPDGRSSIRMERLVEGIQYFEKIRILRNIYKGNATVLKQIDDLLQPMRISELPKVPAEKTVNHIKEELNRL